MPTELTVVEQRRIDAFIERRREHKGKEIDNGSLHAGSPMYFYCRACRIHIATLPENYLTPPPRYCEECQALKDAALLDVAIEAADGTK